MTELHASIRDIPMPEHMQALPLTEAGFPVLFFADTINGKPDLRVMDRRKWNICVKMRRCWFAEKRTATRSEVETSIAGGLPALWGKTLIDKDVKGSQGDLLRYVHDAMRWLPPSPDAVWIIRDKLAELQEAGI